MGVSFKINVQVLMYCFAVLPQTCKMKNLVRNLSFDQKDGIFRFVRDSSTAWLWIKRGDFPAQNHVSWGAREVGEENGTCRESRFE